MERVDHFDSSEYIVAIGTLGCKVNQAESEALARELGVRGCRPVGFDAAADAYILNTCTVTHIADRKARQMLRQARRRNPHAVVMAIGCGASSLKGLSDIIVSNDQKLEVVPKLLKALQGKPHILAAPRQSMVTRTRATVKVQDGCNHLCAYCIVPLVRGREASIPSGQVLAEVASRVEEGHQEVVLTGPQMGGYRDATVGDLSGLVRLLLQKTRVSRLRLSSIEPHRFPDALLDLWPEPRLCRHFHISLQSGSDAVLQAMGRGYKRAQYQDLLERIRSKVPGAAITTDVIVGFPGETAADFAASCEAVASLGFARVHVFPFSSRPGTRAEQMTGKVPDQEKRARCRELQQIGDIAARRFREALRGSVVPVLYEGQNQFGLYSGLTDTYVRVSTFSSRNICNCIQPTLLTDVTGQGVLGEIMDGNSDVDVCEIRVKIAS